MLYWADGGWSGAGELDGVAVVELVRFRPGNKEGVVPPM